MKIVANIEIGLDVVGPNTQQPESISLETACLEADKLLRHLLSDTAIDFYDGPQLRAYVAKASEPFSIIIKSAWR